MESQQSFESYRDLIAWQRGVDLVCLVYEQTKFLPANERFGLIAQMRRCADSVPSNIAEARGRHQGPEYIRFLSFSRGSVFELSTQAEISVRLGFNGEWRKVLDACDEVGRIINGLISSIQRRIDNVAVPSSPTPNP